MLADFQQALADLVASPALSRRVRAEPAALDAGYQLTPRERDRLLGIVGHAGMAAACTVYRMNRIAPLAMNLRGTLRALAGETGGFVEAYWAEHPRGHAHFFLESERFADWLARCPPPPHVRAVLARETLAVRAAIAASGAQAARASSAG